MCSSSFCKRVAMRMKFVLLCSVAVLSLQLVRAQDIAFPEKEHNHLQVNKDNRQPVFIPGRCAKDEWLYPGDQKDDWVCDCGPGYIYYPAEKKCLAAFRQGPCPVGQYIILKPPAVIPTCEKNPCEEDGMVFFNKGCYKLNAASSACKPIEEGGGTLGVNATTLQLGCISSYSDINIAQRKELYCGPGKKNTILEGNCNRKQPTVQNKEPSILQSSSQQGSQQYLQSSSQQGSQQYIQSSSQQGSQQYLQSSSQQGSQQSLQSSSQQGSQQSLQSSSQQGSQQSLQSSSQQGSQQSLQSTSQQGSQQSSQQSSQQHTQPTNVPFPMQPRLLVGIPIELSRPQPILLELIQRLSELNSAIK